MKRIVILACLSFLAGFAHGQESDPTAYQSGMKQACAGLEAAYKQAIKDYVKRGMDTQADSVAHLLEEFQKQAGAGPKQPLLANGTVWTGKKANLPRGEVLSFVLKIADVDGPKFTGEIVIDKQHTFTVAGRVTGDRVTFRTEKKGVAQQTFDGRMSRERMEFAALTMGGERKKGTVSLTLKTK